MEKLLIGYHIILFLHLFLVFRFMSLHLKYSICLESIRRVFMIGLASWPIRFANFPLKYAILKTQWKISKTGPFGLFHYWHQLCAHIRTANIISGENRGFDPASAHRLLLFSEQFQKEEIDLGPGGTLYFMHNICCIWMHRSIYRAGHRRLSKIRLRNQEVSNRGDSFYTLGDDNEYWYENRHLVDFEKNSKPLKKFHQNQKQKSSFSRRMHLPRLILKPVKLPTRIFWTNKIRLTTMRNFLMIGGTMHQIRHQKMKDKYSRKF